MWAELFREGRGGRGVQEEKGGQQEPEDSPGRPASSLGNAVANRYSGLGARGGERSVGISALKEGGGAAVCSFSRGTWNRWVSWPRATAWMTGETEREKAGRGEADERLTAGKRREEPGPQGPCNPHPPHASPVIPTLGLLCVRAQDRPAPALCGRQLPPGCLASPAPLPSTGCAAGAFGWPLCPVGPVPRPPLATEPHQFPPGGG